MLAKSIRGLSEKRLRRYPSQREDDDDAVATYVRW